MDVILALWITTKVVVNFEFDTMGDCRTAAYIAIRLWPVGSRAVCTDTDGRSFEIREDQR